jgi:D-arabinose 1-dehydrogenase-like Zn-dependent alcohol dehydrogenase
MSHSSYALLMEQDHDIATIKALGFHGRGNISLETVPIPKARAGEVVIRVTLTTIGGTDLHILKGEYPVKPGLIIGYEPVGVIHEIGDGVTGYEVLIDCWDKVSIWTSMSPVVGSLSDGEKPFRVPPSILTRVH